MSSDDVIELGSSDEDPEPAPKRSKPMPNAMVCIPRKLHEVTIKPAKLNSTSRPLKPHQTPTPKAVLSKAIIIKKTTNTKPQTVVKNKLNGKSVPFQTKSKIAYNPFADCQKPGMLHNKPGNSRVGLINTDNINSLIGKSCLPIKIQNANIINLPPSITVKKTVSNRPIVLLNVKSKQQLNQKKKAVADGTTVELDDDDTSTRTSSPQWYLRPEEQKEIPILEEENNKEPDAPKLIEITIEDSPIKPVHNKRTHEVGAELAITIDDSPVKTTFESKSKNTSDSEGNADTDKIPHSKKKLEYPKEAERQTVEIEIDPIVININTSSNVNDIAVVNVIEDKATKLNTEKECVSTKINTEKQCVSTPPKDTKKQCTPPKENKNVMEISSESEFHPVYQSFIDLCFQLENSDDMKKIVEKKIKGYYRQVPKEYTESEEFTDMVSSKILSMKAGPEKMYLYIKDIVDELNMQRKFAKSQPPPKEIKNEEPPEECGEDSKYDSKRQRQIRKLEKTIKKLHRAIQKLEEQEVDFDDEDDSVYLLTERYKERMVRVYAKFCQLSNTKMPSEPRIQIDARPGQPSGPAKRLEKWINKKVPIGTPLPFPDFHDVLRCVREANDSDKLNFNEADIMEEARDLFTRCGKKLQRRRQENEWRSAASRIALDIDPAQNDDELKRRLNDNRKIAATKETEIFNKFADRQNQLKLEAKEIGDKEADESPVESDEEEANDENVSLENTEKRKERLKRLLQEKSKKTLDEKENQPQHQKNDIDSKTSEMSVEIEIPAKTDGNESHKKEEDNKESHKKEEDNKESQKKKEVDIKEIAERSNKEEDDVEENIEESYETTQNASETLTLSDDSNELESDIDELHLLQKLHSGNEEQSSTVNTSDSDSPIAISDSLESSEDCKKDTDDAGDVISIENSSYSENENDTIVNTQTSNTESVQFIDETEQSQDTAAVRNTIDTEIPSIEVHAPPQTNNDECNGAVEDILLASSEEENSQDAIESPCVNLRDDLISIDETIIGNINNQPDIQAEKEPIQEKHNEKESLEMNIDSKLSTKDNDVILDAEKISHATCEITIEEHSNESIEKMDVDEDTVANETEKDVSAQSESL